MRISIGFCTILAGITSSGPVTAEDDPRGQYKKKNRDQVTVIAQGDPEKALRYADDFLEEHPGDLECLYLRALTLAKMGRGGESLVAAEKAVKGGLPAGRIAAGPRNLFSALYAEPGYQAFAKRHLGRLIHGPLVGAVTDSRARIWVRTAEEVEVGVTVSRDREGRDEVARGSGKTTGASDFTSVVEVDGLEPGTRYFYGLSLGDEEFEFGDGVRPSFRTFPEQGKAAQFEIGFGGGAGYTPWKEHMWTTVRESDPLAFFLLGDNVYIDTPECPETQRYCYYRRQSRPEFRAFSELVPVFAIWDDHDFGTNDCTSSLDPERPRWKRDVLDVFTENWANPSYGGGKDVPGVWFRMAIGDVDFFFLDCRYYRQNPKEVETPSMLGPVQKRWLLEGLKESTATFKILCSSVPWAPGAKGKSKDTWDGFPEERQKIFGFLAEHEISGAVLMAADRHRSDAWKIRREKGYPLYEFQSSKLTNVHTHPVLPGALFGTKENSFGLVAFDTEAEDPTVTYRVMGIGGEELHRMELKLSELGVRD